MAPRHDCYQPIDMHNFSALRAMRKTFSTQLLPEAPNAPMQPVGPIPGAHGLVGPWTRIVEWAGGRDGQVGAEMICIGIDSVSCIELNSDERQKGNESGNGGFAIASDQDARNATFPGNHKDWNIHSCIDGDPAISVGD